MMARSSFKGSGNEIGLQAITVLLEGTRTRQDAVQSPDGSAMFCEMEMEMEMKMGDGEMKVEMRRKDSDQEVGCTC